MKDIFDVRNYLRDQIEAHEPIKEVSNPKNRITLYHGTTTAYLVDILKNGIRPRCYTNNSNYEHQHRSANNAVYLTDKWHYMYAVQVTDKYIKNKYGDNGLPWWTNRESFPVYIKLNIPKEHLAIDEDIVFSKYFKDIVRQNKDFTATWKESLKHYRTATFIGEIPVEYIEEITVLGDTGFIVKEICDDNSAYYKDYANVMKGVSVGKRIKDISVIKKKEIKSPLNITIKPQDLIGINKVEFGIFNGRLKFLKR